MNTYAAYALAAFAFLMGIASGWGMGAHDMQRRILATLDALRATVDAAARDAARYRYLREADVSLKEVYRGGVFIGQTPENLVLNGDDADQAVDQLMRAGR